MFLAGIAAALLLSPVAWSDVIILDDGTVIECKIKEIKYPDPKVTSKFVVVAAVDEKGTVKTFKSDDIKPDAAGVNRKAIYIMKTRWEKRADYLKEYTEQKLKYVKDTWESQRDIGKWCKSHLLADKANEHYLKAYQLRAAQLKAWLADGKIKHEEEVDQHLKIAKWCEKELGLHDQAKAEFMTAYELKKTAAGEPTADVHCALGKWCETVGLDDEAMKEYEAALSVNQKHAGAQGAISRIQNSLEFKCKQLVVDYAQSQRAWSFTVTVEDQADRKFLETWAKKIQDLSDYIFEITEGQFFIAECEIEDNASDGKILIEKGKMGWRGTSNEQGNGVLAFCVGPGGSGWVVHCAGKSATSVLAHEVFHGVFGLPDEYYQDPQCDCLMRSAPNPQKVCDQSTHTQGTARQGGEAKDCWRIIIGRSEFKGTVAHPNPNWTWAAKDGTQKAPKNGDGIDGSRNGGGELKYKGIKVAEAPRTVIRIVDN